MNTLNKKVLIIKPEYRYFPVGIAYIIAALEKKNIEYDFIDTFIDPNPQLDVILRSNVYGAVASGGLIGSYQFFKRIFSAIKSINPGITCILGGNITTDVKPDILFNSVPVDYLIRGEAEITFPELLTCLDYGGDITTINGIIYQDSNHTIQKNQRRPILDIVNENWMPSWDFLNMKPYGFHSMPILSGRGCIGRCSFCSPTNGRFRARGLEHIFEEMEYLNSKYEFANFAFMNEVFLSDDETIYKFCEEYKKFKPFKIWHCLMRLDANPDILPVMRDAGCTLMNVGVESGSDRVLQNIKKDITTENTRRFIPAAKKSGIITQASFMLANYDENAEDIRKTIDLMIDLKISGGPVLLAINYPGTLNYRRALKRGLIDNETEYIDTLHEIFIRGYYEVISDHLAGKLNYLNLSGMKTNEMFQVVEQEMRRYYSVNFRIPDDSVQIKKNKDMVEISSSCPFCETSLTICDEKAAMMPNFLRIDCNTCGTAGLYFNPFLFKEYENYISTILDAIRKAQRIAIIGNSDEIRWFLTYDLFGVNYEQIVGIVSHTDLQIGFALNHPILVLDEIIERDPDLFIVVSRIPNDLKATMDRENTVTWQKTVFLTHYSKKYEAYANIESRHLGLDLLKYARHFFQQTKYSDDYSCAIDELAFAQGEDFWKRISQLYSVYESAFTKSNLPALNALEIDLKNSFFGTGWGVADEDIHGTRWRWIGPQGISTLYVYLEKGHDYELRGLIHTALGDSQNQLQVLVNEVPILNKTFEVVGPDVFYTITIPKEVIDKTGGKTKIVYRLPEKIKTEIVSKNETCSSQKIFAFSKIFLQKTSKEMFPISSKGKLHFLFNTFVGLDYDLYDYAVKKLQKINKNMEFSSVLESLAEQKSDMLHESVRLLDERYEKVIKESDFKVESEVDLDLKELFLGTGWGKAEEDMNGICWRWIGPSGTSICYFRLKNSNDYLLKSLIHTARGDSQNRFNVSINGENILNPTIALEGSDVFHNCVIQQQLIGQSNSWVKITYSLFGAGRSFVGENDPTQFREKEFALSRVICRPFV
jgi:anaerobic magnesium-protoporphyrin IX monomethyl ester cyclase